MGKEMKKYSRLSLYWKSFVTNIISSIRRVKLSNNFFYVKSCFLNRYSERKFVYKKSYITNNFTISELYSKLILNTKSFIKNNYKTFCFPNNFSIREVVFQNFLYEKLYSTHNFYRKICFPRTFYGKSVLYEKLYSKHIFYTKSYI